MRHLVWITAIVLATLTAAILAWQLRVVVLVFLFSLWTSAAVRPAVDFLDRRGLRRGIALVVTYLIGASLLVLLALLLANPLFNEVRQLADDSASGFTQLTKRWEHGSRLQQALVKALPLPEHLIAEFSGRQGLQALESLLGFTFGLFDAGMHLIIIVVLSLYWSLDRVHFERLWLSLLPVEQRINARSLWRDMEAELGGYIRSEVTQCLAAGALLAGAYTVLGYPYPILLGTVAALCWLIPWLGVVFAVLVALLFALPTAMIHGIDGSLVVATASALVTLAVLLALEIVVEPKFFRRARYNALLTVVLVVALADVFGIVGLILGPPLAALVQIIGRHLLHRRLARQRVEPAPPAPSLDERLIAIRAALASRRNPPAELVNLANRVEALVNELSELTPAPPVNASANEYAREVSTAT